jgi:hypothetical protein
MDGDGAGTCGASVQRHARIGKMPDKGRHQPTGTGGIMGIFDKLRPQANQDADQQSGDQDSQFDQGNQPDQGTQGMQAAQQFVGQQGGDPTEGGYQDPNQDPGQQGSYQDPNQDPNQQGGYEQDQGY